jgi:hypothetical protein
MVRLPAGRTQESSPTEASKLVVELACLLDDVGLPTCKPISPRTAARQSCSIPITLLMPPHWLVEQAAA